MQQFLRIFVDIVLWRRGPQDLPSSSLLLALTVAAYLGVSVIQLALDDESAATWFFFLVIDPLLLAAWVWLVLRIFRHPERSLQTEAAVFGTGAVLGLFMYLPLQLLMSGLGFEPTSGAAQALGLLTVLVFAFVTGRIIKLATATNLFTGVAASLTYFLVVNYLVVALRGPGT